MKTRNLTYVPIAGAIMLAIAIVLSMTLIACASDEITLAGSLQVEKGELDVYRKISNLKADMSGNIITHAIQSIGTNKETLTIQSDHSTVGWCMMLNLDATNQVVGGVDADAALFKIKAGEFGLFRLSTNSISMKSLTNSVYVEYWVIDD